jgi:hypothetical protein
MKHVPTATLVPSESTVEQIANHQILCHVSPFGAWFYVPTRREEKRLAYDASLQGHKALVIQYKRFHPSKNGGRVNLSIKQHRKLMSNFPKAATPYVFYGFALHANYGEIDTQFADGFGILFGLWTWFVDAHSVPVGAKSISVSARYLFPSITSGRAGTALSAWCLPTLVREFQSCKAGLRAESLLELPQGREEAVADTAQETLPHLNVLWARIS